MFVEIQSDHLTVRVLPLLFTRPVTSHVTLASCTSHAQPSPKKRGETETCGVFYGREPNVHRFPPREGLRRDEAQDCSVPAQLENTRKHNCCNLRVAQSKSQEVKRRIVQQNVSVSHCTAKSCTEAELEL